MYPCIFKTFSKNFALSKALNLGSVTHSFHTSSAACIHLSETLGREPLKKKKRIDPMIAKMRGDRKRRHLMKDIRLLKKNEQQLKPIEENIIPLNLITERSLRVRKLQNLTEEQFDEEISLQKDWARYKCQLHIKDMAVINKVVAAKERALKELEAESRDLYNEAIQLDLLMLPLRIEGPTRTPAPVNYEPPDGDYQDITRKWEWNKQSHEEYFKNRKALHILKRKKVVNEDE